MMVLIRTTSASLERLQDSKVTMLTTKKDPTPQFRLDLVPGRRRERALFVSWLARPSHHHSLAATHLARPQHRLR